MNIKLPFPFEKRELKIEILEKRIRIDKNVEETSLSKACRILPKDFEDAGRCRAQFGY
jgi:hypothetical protein